jgi:mannose-6-phosphate isomerase class I
MRSSSYDKFPVISIKYPEPCAWQGWDDIGRRLNEAWHGSCKPRVVMAVDCYTGVLDDEILPALIQILSPKLVVNTAVAMKSSEMIDAMIEPYLGDDPVFGHMTYLCLHDFFDVDHAAELRRIIAAASDGLVLVYGVGAALIAEKADILVYADLARWEAQLRYRRDEISNLGVDNHTLKASLQYKRAFFVDWRVCDKHKKILMDRWDFVLDTNSAGAPKLVSGEAIREGLRQTAKRPFRLQPFFDMAPWGGQWMKKVCSLDPAMENFGWCFDCVPEENSLLLGFGDVTIEIPSIDLVFYQPRALLGDAVHARFGTEFPIRFDFLDTMNGGNLSFQVHPLTEYIQANFGMHYTQDESYYMLDAKPDACVYLGIKEGINQRAMSDDLYAAQRGGKLFPVEQYVNRWPANKHDHFLIPAGTCHCSGKDGMVLEISATPYIFTFKMWDWGRMGLDSMPRPVHLEHGLANVQWDRSTQWVRRELINIITPLGSGPGWREEKTGLHEREFIETRRHWFTKIVPHDTRGGVNVLNLVEGDEALVESPDGDFEPFVIHYAETFIVPAAVGRYTIRPNGAAIGKECATIKAMIRSEACLQKNGGME